MSEAVTSDEDETDNEDQNQLVPPMRGKQLPMRGKQLRYPHSNPNKALSTNDSSSTNNSSSTDDSSSTNNSPSLSQSSSEESLSEEKEEEDALSEEEEEKDDDEIPARRKLVLSVNRRHPLQENLDLFLVVLPTLQLHVSSNAQSPSMEPPNTAACTFNMRKLNFSRLTCLKTEDNMLCSLRAEKEGYEKMSSVVQGMYAGVFSSYIEKSQTPSLPMTSVLRPENEDSASYHAIPLTSDIIKDAMQWLHGIDWEKQLPENETEDEHSIQQLLKNYLTLLQEKIPKENSLCDLKNFILDHKWSPDSWGSNTQAYNRLCGSHLCEKTNNNEPVEDANLEDVYFLRRFIHENLARQTKIVVHIVDGIHRVTTADCVLIGYTGPQHANKEEKDAIRNYATRSPHKNLKVRVNCFTPEKINERYRTLMREKSSHIQKMANLQRDHTVLDILGNKMKILAKKCDECDVPYLWDCLGVVFKVVADQEVSQQDVHVMTMGIHPHSRDGQELLHQIACLSQDSNTPRENIIENYIRLWVENVCSKIIPVLKGSSHWGMLGLGSQSDSNSDIQDKDFSLFRREVTTARLKVQIYDLFPCYTNQMRLNYFICPKNKAPDLAAKATGTVEDFKSVMNENRFNKNYKDVMFVVCQILLWSMTCKDTQSRLTHLFSSTPTTLQYDLGSSEDAYRWMMNLFHSICDSISKSYQPWKTGFFVPHADHPIQRNPQQVIVLCLLGSAIEKCSDFYSFQGMRPVWPEELQQLRDRLTRILTKSRQEGGDAYPDMLTAISISHMLRMECMPKNTKKTMVFRDRLKRSWLSKYNHKSRYQMLSKNTIGGNATADPRGSDGEKLIAIVSI